MRRGLQLAGLSGLLVTGFVSTHAFAQEPTNADPKQPAEEPNTEQQTPDAAGATVTPDATVVAPVAKPKFGDLTTHGYFRGGMGGNINKKGRMTCFGLGSINGGLLSKYRLGNECEQWGEFLLSTVVYAGDDGSVATFHFRPVAYIPTSLDGYSPSMTTSSQSQSGLGSTGATVSFPDLYADIKGISWLFGGTAWAGSRYYKRESIYISDFFYWNPSGVGAGIEDINVAKIFDWSSDVVRDLTFSYAAFAVDGDPASGGNTYLPQQYAFGVRNDVQLRGFRPYKGGELQVGFQYIKDWSGDKNGGGNSVPPTHDGLGVTVRLVQEVLGGDNKLVFQYGRGGGTGFGTLARFYYPDFSLGLAFSESRLRVLDVLTIQPTDYLGAQVAVVYQHDNNNVGTPSAGDWVSAGTRLSFAFTEHAKLLGEVGHDSVWPKYGTTGRRSLTKLTGALAIAAAKGFWGRPELRLFYTWAMWSKSAPMSNTSVDSSDLYTSADPETGVYTLSGSIAGVQAEVMW
jgi:maltoporin